MSKRYLYYSEGSKKGEGKKTIVLKVNRIDFDKVNAIYLNSNNILSVSGLGFNIEVPFVLSPSLYRLEKYYKSSNVLGGYDLKFEKVYE